MLDPNAQKMEHAMKEEEAKNDQAGAGAAAAPEQDQDIAMAKELEKMKIPEEVTIDIEVVEEAIDQAGAGAAAAPEHYQDKAMAKQPKKMKMPKDVIIDIEVVEEAIDQAGAGAAAAPEQDQYIAMAKQPEKMELPEDVIINIEVLEEAIDQAGAGAAATPEQDQDIEMAKQLDTMEMPEEVTINAEVVEEAIRQIIDQNISDFKDFQFPHKKMDILHDLMYKEIYARIKMFSADKVDVDMIVKAYRSHFDKAGDVNYLIKCFKDINLDSEFVVRPMTSGRSGGYLVPKPGPTPSTCFIPIERPLSGSGEQGQQRVMMKRAGNVKREAQFKPSSPYRERKLYDAYFKDIKEEE